MLMKSLRYEAMALTIVFLALAGIACAQFSSDGTIVYMGDLSMQASSHWSNQAARAPEATILGAAANNSTQNATALDNQTMNDTSEKTLALVPLGNAKPVDAAQPSDKGIMDLSAYAKDRANGSLTGYTNIMYPITGSKGTTASTSSGGGCCGGG
jgi:hypothetical protein